MVFKTLHLARQSIAKTFAHGYAQPLVAASQSSYASQNSPLNSFGANASNRHGKLGPNQIQQALHSTSAQLSLGNTPIAGSAEAGDSNLATYYAAWQKHQKADDKDLKKIQFTKQICWKSTVPTENPNLHAERATDIAGKESLVEETETSEPKGDSAVDAKQEGASSRETFSVSNYDRNLLAEPTASTGPVNNEHSFEIPSSVGESSSYNEIGIHGSDSSSTKARSSDNVVVSEDLLATSQEVETIEHHHVRSSSIARDSPANAATYNTLLAAAISAPRARHRVVPKALAIYADMLRRRIQPDTSTYSILIELLSSRVLDVIESKRVLQEKMIRFGGFEEAGKFMFRSNAADYEILTEDDSLGNAVKIFDAATSQNVRTFSLDTYKSLIMSCAESNRVDEMVRVYTHMESQNIEPSAEIFIYMIQAFARAGDLRSSVECYNGYKDFATANDIGENSLARNDNGVYTALVKAYNICRRSSQGLQFLNKVETSLHKTGTFYKLQEMIVLEVSIPEMLRAGNYAAALDLASGLRSSTRDNAHTSICIASADNNATEMATKSFDLLSANSDISGPAMAMGAMYIRIANLNAAEPFWNLLENSSTRPQSIEFTAMHTIASIGSGQAERGLRQCRNMFARIRASNLPNDKMDFVDQIDEAIELIGHFIMKNAIVLSPSESMHLCRSMIDNGGLIPSVAGHLLAGLGPEGIAELGKVDVTLLIQIQAGMITKTTVMDVANEARFENLLQVAMRSRISFDNETSELINDVLTILQNHALATQWHSYVQEKSEALSIVTNSSYSPQSSLTSVSPYEESFDPYASTTDNKGSVAIIDILERSRGRSSTNLQDALSRFKNMRRVGRHPRFYTYSKLILAAAKENQLNVAQDVFALAKQDVPFLPQYRLIRYGWVTILDAMVSACLTVGERQMAISYHQDLLNIGAAPTANTFGLYITTLKDSTRTFDEASEAVKVFLRARSEGVEPSSFLYNALIGKLGKARRIDDCLFYFSEMRNKGIRPTSVTYGTIVNALCRVSDEKFAEELFEEMESMPNYKPRPAPYHSLMQYFLTTKRDRSKVLAYYERMRASRITPTMHTYKLLIDTHATLEPVQMSEAEAVLNQISRSGQSPEAVHYASLIHAKGCVQHDMSAAKEMFDNIIEAKVIRPQACLYQALFEAMVANHQVAGTDVVLRDMYAKGVEMTPYIANSLIHGWALAGDISHVKQIFGSVSAYKREPSTYEAMTRALIAAGDRDGATSVVTEMSARGYPAAVANKIADLLTGGR